MTKNNPVKWLDKPEDQDYGAAKNYLGLLYAEKKARRWSKALRSAEMSNFAAKDLLRASGTPISEVQAFDWTKQHQAIAQGKALSPILIVREGKGGRLIIADGFHRLCAVFATDQEMMVPCKIV